MQRDRQIEVTINRNGSLIAVVSVGLLGISWAKFSHPWHFNRPDDFQVSQITPFVPAV